MHGSVAVKPEQRSSTRMVAALLCLALVLLTFLFALRATKAAPAPGDEKPIASITMRIGRGDFTWQSTEFTTLSSSSPEVSFHRGFVVALDDMISMTNVGRDGFKRLQPETAMPVDEGQRFLPLSLTLGPAAFLALELVDPDDADDPEGRSFAIHGGQYSIALWRIDVEDGDAESANDVLRALTAPALLYVRSGAVTPQNTSASPARWNEGNGRTVDKKTRLKVTASGDAVLLLATIHRTDPPSVKATATSDRAIATRTSGGTNGNSGNGSVAGANGGPAHEPTPTPTSSPTETPGDDPDGESLPSGGSSGGGSNGGLGEFGVVQHPGIGTCYTAFDPDQDGLTTCEEETYGTNPNDADSDRDGLYDNQEIAFGSNPNSSDSDLDFLTDYQEWIGGTNPLSADSDGDGIDDSTEYHLGTAPTNSDTDGDGLTDGEELNGYGSNPSGTDSDGDLCSDGYEVLSMGTNPTILDTDGDDYWDSSEWGISNPNDPNDTPASVFEQFTLTCE